jgi:hypothetical protein
MNKYKYKLNTEKNEVNLKEKVINGKKVYNTNEVNKWVKYGLDMGYIDKSKKSEIIDWIKILRDKTIDL